MSATIPCFPDLPGPSRPESDQPKPGRPGTARPLRWPGNATRTTWKTRACDEQRFHHYTCEELLGEFFPALVDKAEIAAGVKQLRAEQRAWRLAEMRRRLGVTQAEVAQRMGVTQGRVSAIEHAKPGATELRTLARLRRRPGGAPPR